MQSINIDDSQYFQYQMLGYYDGLDINVVDNWYDLRPRGLHNRNLQISLTLPFIDQYTIRAIMPQNRDKLSQEGFYYPFWEKVGQLSETTFAEYELETRKKFPYITMSVVNLSEKYVKENSDLISLQEGIITAIKEKMKTKTNLQELHCAVFPSIGYSDFVILCMTDSLKKSSNVIEALRGVRSKQGNNIVSNCYSVCGLDKIYFSDLENDHFDEDVKVTIRINLREGIAPNYFFHALKENLKRNIQEERVVQHIYELENFLKEIEDHFYVTFGNSDCLVLSEKPLPSYLRLHATGQILNPGTDFFERYIANVRTSVRVKGFAYDAPFQTGEERRNLDFYEKSFDEFIKSYNNFISQNYMPIRSSKALQQIMKNFLNIAYAGHSFDVVHVLGNAFLSLFQNMYFYIKNATPVFEQSTTSPKESPFIQEELDYTKYQKQEAVEALTIFKDNIGILIADLLRSDRPFIEGNTLTHPSIGSATKLMFAYTAILEKITIKFEVSNSFTFVVASGGCDTTKAIDLFSFATPTDSINKLIFIEIPEMSLYDIQGTLFRLLHECMHFIGERKRKERYFHLISALSYAIAWDVIETEFSDERKEQLEKVIKILPSVEQKAFSDYLSNEFIKLKDIAVKKIAKAIATHDAFSKYAEATDSAIFYSEVIQQNILTANNIIEILRTPQNANECLQKKIYKILYSLDKEIINAICKYFEERYKELRANTHDFENAERLKFAVQPYIMFKQNYVFLDSNSDMHDIKLEKFIMRYFDSMINEISFYQDGEENICEYPFEEIRDSIINSMIESFADCGAISCLNMKLEDFLLAFIYEMQDINHALPLTITNILRLGADLKVMFKIEGGITPEIADKVKMKVKSRENQGFVYTSADNMLIQINIILQRYSAPRYALIRNEIEEYLNLCFKNSDWTIPPLKDLYSSCDLDSSDKIYDVIDEIFKQWKSLCEEQIL